MTEPLTPPECDLRGMAFMPLDVARLTDSDLTAISTGDEFKAAIMLWYKSWSQVPAASLPDNDVVLAPLAGCGPEEWEKVKRVSLRGFVRCSDGRLYHPVIAEKALEAWAGRQRSAVKREADRKRLKDWREVKRERRSDETRVKRVSKRGRNANETPKTVTVKGIETPSLRSGVSDAPAHPEKLKRVSIKHVIPGDLALSEKGRAFAAQRGFLNGTVDAMWERFTSYHASKGTQSADFEASWRTWVLNQEQFQGARHEPAGDFRPARKPRNAVEAILSDVGRSSGERRGDPVHPGDGGEAGPGFGGAPLFARDRR